MQIERDNFKPDTWRVCEGDKIYWVQLRRSAHGPSWSASVFVQPRSDQKPYWRPLRNWQRFAGAVRAFENNK